MKELIGLKVSEAKEYLEKNKIEFEEKTIKKMTLKEKSGYIVKVEKDKETKKIVLYESNRKQLVLIMILAVLVVLGFTSAFGNGIYKSIQEQIIEIKGEITAPELEVEEGWKKEHIIKVIKDSKSNKELSHYEYCVREDKKKECEWKETYTKNVIVGESGHFYVTLRGVDVEGNKGKEKTVEVYVDNNNPEVESFKVIEKTQDSIKVKTEAKDKESGIEKYMYSQDGINYTEGKEEYTYSNLEAGKNRIYVKVIDKVGNETVVSIEVEIKTEEPKQEEGTKNPEGNKVEEKEWDIPKINLDKVPSVFTYGEEYNLPSYYDFGNDLGKVVCEVDGKEEKDTSKLIVGKHTIVCRATSNHGKETEVRKEIEVEVIKGADEIFDGWIRLNLYYPEGSTEWQWRLDGENGIRTGYNGDNWQNYTGPILIKLEDTENVYIRYKLKGETVIIAPKGKVVVDIEPEKWTLRNNETTKVKINYDSNAKTKKYRLDGGVWQDYQGEFEVGANVLIEAKATKEEKVYDSEGEYQYTKTLTGVDTAYISMYVEPGQAVPQGPSGIPVVPVTPTTPTTPTNPTTPTGPVITQPQPGTPSPSILEGPIISSNPSSSIVEEVEVEVTPQEEAYKVYYRINSGSYQEYKGKFTVKENCIVYAYYVRKSDGMTSATSGYQVNNIKVGNLPYVRIEANPSYLGTNIESTEVRISGSDYDTLEYSLDGVLYQDYTSPLTITESKTVYARGTNRYGQKIEYVVITTKTPPTVVEKEDLTVTIEANPSDNNNSLIAYTDVTITYDSKATNKYYSIDGGNTYQSYTGPFRVNKNTTVVGYATSKNGSGEARMMIDYINNGISSPIIKSDPISPTQAYKVVVEIKYDKNATVKQYKIGNGLYQDYQGPIEVENNTTITAYNKNILNEDATSTLTITNIVPEPRYVPVDLGDYYLLKLNYPDASEEESREYKWKETGNWEKYEKPGILLIKKEAASKYDLTADGLEVEDQQGKKVRVAMKYVYVLDVPASELSENIFMRWDTVKPKTPEIYINPEEATKEAEVRISYANQIVEKYYKVVDSDGVDSGWMEYTGPFKVTKNNTTIYAKGTDRSEVKSEIASKKITNIDEIAPTISIKGDFITAKRSIPVQITAEDNLGLYMVKYASGSHNADYFNEEKEDNGKSIRNASTVTITENGIYTIYAVDSVGNETVKEIKVENVDLEAPDITIEVLTQGVRTEARVSIDYGDSETKEYSIGDNTHYQTYSDVLTLSSYDYYNKKNEDGSLTLYVKGKDSAGNIREIEEKLYCLDLDKPNDPVITLNMDYPTLTQEGFTTENSIEITYDNRNDIINEISLDNGETWKTYRRTEIITDEEKVMARSKKITTGFTSTSEKEIKALTDSLIGVAYDQNNETEQEILSGKSAIFKVENDGKARKITIRSNKASGSKVNIYGIDGNINKTVDITEATQSISLPSGTTKVEIVGPLKVAEIVLNGIVEVVEGESIISILENNNLKEGYYNFKVTGNNGTETTTEVYPVHLYVLDGNQTITENTTYGDAYDIGTKNSYAENMVIVKVNGDYTVNEGVTVAPYSTEYGGPKGFTLYVTGKLTNNGTIDNSHGAYAQGQDVYLWKNADGTYEYVPKVGGSGGINSNSYPSSGVSGTSGSSRQTGGGGGGGRIWNTNTSNGVNNSGGTGTSYSGGAGGGGIYCSWNNTPGSDNGGAGGSGQGGLTSGGSGNPGGSGENKGSNGTGGLLIVYSNELENNGLFSAHGYNGGEATFAAGGSSGGGSINVFTNQSTGMDRLGIDINSKYNEILGSFSIYGGSVSTSGQGYSGGAGGTGSINIGEIRNGQYCDLKDCIAQDISDYKEEKTIVGESIISILKENVNLKAGYYNFKVTGNNGSETTTENYSVHLYVLNGNQTISEDTTYGDAGDISQDVAATATSEAYRAYAQNMVIVKVNGDYTVNEGVTVAPYSTQYGGPKGFLLYVTGKLTNNGTIDNSHGAYAVGQDVYLWKNADETYEFVPKVGGSGGINSNSYPSSGVSGTSGSSRQTGGGGGGGRIWNTNTSNGVNNSGGTGTSYSGGAGGGGIYYSWNNTPGSDNGGAGGSGQGGLTSGGAGNAGGSGEKKGSNGTGGLLILYSNELQNNGLFSAHGYNGGEATFAAGGSSGGGSINIFYNNIVTKGSLNVSGGSVRVAGQGSWSGAGGSGTVTYMKIIPNIVTFDANGGTVSETTREIGDRKSIGDLPIPSRAEFNFSGWYTSLSFNTKVTENYVPEADVTLYAKWNSIYDKEIKYSGSEDTFTVQKSGIYKLEVWGAQGGNYNGYVGGYGGYSSGYVSLTQGQTLYINVGGTNSINSTTGGYNGGGRASSQAGGYYGAGGGGATHIGLASGLLTSFENKTNDLLIVAGGGGGAASSSVGNSTTNGHGGHAGGYVGVNGTASDSSADRTPGKGGSQTTFGATYGSYSSYTQAQFGRGCMASSSYNSYMRVSGGGGYYGGGCGIHSGGGGGSGFIVNLTSYNSDFKHMYCYNCTTSSEKETYTLSNGTSSCHNEDPTADCAKEGNGYARITFIEGTPNRSSKKAVKKKIEAPVVNVENTDTGKLVTVVNNTEYKLEYSLDYGTTWFEYTDGIKVDKNTTIFTRVVDNGKVVSSSTYTITSIKEIEEVKEESTNVLPSETIPEIVEEKTKEEEKPKEGEDSETNE